MCTTVLSLFSRWLGCSAEDYPPPAPHLFSRNNQLIPPDSDPTVPRLMVISLDLEDVDTLIDALLPNVKPVVYHADQTSREELGRLVLEHGRHIKPQSLAVASRGPLFGDITKGHFHHWELRFAKDNVVRFNGETLNVEMPPVPGQHPLYDALVAILPPGAEVHMLGAELIATPEGRATVRLFEERTGLVFAASAGITEETWLLECHGRTIDVAALYFNKSKLRRWRGTTACVQQCSLDDLTLYPPGTSPPRPISAAFSAPPSAQSPVQPSGGAAPWTAEV